MNTSCRELVDRLFIKVLHRNKDNNDIDDVEALAYLNEATREVFRWYALYLPQHIKARYTYEAVEGEDIFTLPAPAALIQKMTINNIHVVPESPMVPPYRVSGPPTYKLVMFDKVEVGNYTVKNRDKILIEYTPAEIVKLVIPTQQDPLQPGETDKSYFPQMWDDSLIEHAMISYEAARGMMQDAEGSQRSKWTQQIIALFSDQIEVTSVGEYWQGYAPRGDML